MQNPFDGWTLAHGLTGFFLGRIKFNRSMFYPLTIAWEIYQISFHYQPQGYYPKYVWINSLIDILSCVICYEAAIRYSFKYDRFRPWLGTSDNIKGIAAYAFVTSSVAWLFWDDIFRLGLLKDTISFQIPLLLGAFSPLVACFIVRQHISKAASSSNNRIASILNNQCFYYVITGLLPSGLAFLVVSLVTG